MIARMTHCCPKYLKLIKCCIVFYSAMFFSSSVCSKTHSLPLRFWVGVEMIDFLIILPVYQGYSSSKGIRESSIISHSDTFAK